MVPRLLHSGHLLHDGHELLVLCVLQFILQGDLITKLSRVPVGRSHCVDCLVWTDEEEEEEEEGLGTRETERKLVWLSFDYLLPDGPSPGPSLS